MGLVFGKDAAEEGGAVGEGDGVALVGGVDGLVGIEDGDEKAFLAAVGDGAEVGAVHGEAFRRKMAGGAELIEDFAARRFVALEFQSGAEGVELFGRLLEKLGSLFADGGIGMGEKKLTAGGVEIGG